MTGGKPEYRESKGCVRHTQSSPHPQPDLLFPQDHRGLRYGISQLPSHHSTFTPISTSFPPLSDASSQGDSFPGGPWPILPYLPCLTCPLPCLYSFFLPCRITRMKLNFSKKDSLLHSSLCRQSHLKESSLSPLPSPSSILHNLASVPPTPLTGRPPCCEVQSRVGPVLRALSAAFAPVTTHSGISARLTPSASHSPTCPSPLSASPATSPLPTP